MKRKGCFFCAALVICSILTSFTVGCGEINKTRGMSEGVEYVSMWNSWEPQASYLKQMASDFEKEMGVQVKLEFVGRDVLTKVKSRFLMGDPPDLVDQDFNELAAAISIGSLQATDIEEMLYTEKGPEGQDRLIDIFGDKFMRLYEKDGRLCLFPYEFITSGFFYDKGLYKKFGLQVPRTWEDFLMNGDVLKSSNIRPLADDGNINFYNAYYFCWAVERIFGPGSFRQAAQDKNGDTWNNQGYLQAAEMVYELSKAKKNFFQEGYDKSEWPTAQCEWADGKHGNILCATWIPQETKMYTKPEFDYGFFPFPEINGGKGKATDVEIGYIGCAIPKGSKNVSSAKAFLRFMLLKENAQKFHTMTNSISARNDMDYPAILSSVQGYTKKITTPYKSYDGVWADLPDWWSKVFIPLDDQLFFGKLSPDKFIKQIKLDSAGFWSRKKDEK